MIQRLHDHAHMMTQPRPLDSETMLGAIGVSIKPLERIVVSQDGAEVVIEADAVPDLILLLKKMFKIIKEDPSNGK